MAFFDRLRELAAAPAARVGGVAPLEVHELREVAPPPASVPAPGPAPGPRVTRTEPPPGEPRDAPAPAQAASAAEPRAHGAVMEPESEPAPFTRQVAGQPPAIDFLAEPPVEAAPPPPGSQLEVTAHLPAEPSVAQPTDIRPHPLAAPEQPSPPARTLSEAPNGDHFPAVPPPAPTRPGPPTPEPSPANPSPGPLEAPAPQEAVQRTHEALTEVRRWMEAPTPAVAAAPAAPHPVAAAGDPVAAPLAPQVVEEHTELSIGTVQVTVEAPPPPVGRRAERSGNPPARPRHEAVPRDYLRGW